MSPSSPRPGTTPSWGSREACYAGDVDRAPLDFALHPCDDGGMTRRLMAADRKAHAVQNAGMKHRS